MSKECVEIAVASTMLLDAHKQLTEFGSSADDRDSDPLTRRAKFFCARVINHASMEMAAVQAAGVVLGMRSSGSSDDISYCAPWDVRKLARIVESGVYDDTDFARELSEDDAPAAAEHADDGVRLDIDAEEAELRRLEAGSVAGSDDDDGGGGSDDDDANALARGAPLEAAFAETVGQGTVAPAAQVAAAAAAAGAPAGPAGEGVRRDVQVDLLGFFRQRGGTETGASTVYNGKAGEKARCGGSLEVAWR